MWWKMQFPTFYPSEGTNAGVEINLLFEWFRICYSVSSTDGKESQTEPKWRFCRLVQDAAQGTKSLSDLQEQQRWRRLTQCGRRLPVAFVRDLTNSLRHTGHHLAPLSQQMCFFFLALSLWPGLEHKLISLFFESRVSSLPFLSSYPVIFSICLLLIFLSLVLSLLFIP